MVGNGAPSFFYLERSCLILWFTRSLHQLISSEELDGDLGAKDSLKLQLPKIKSRHKISNRSSQTISIQRNSTTVKDP
ncbi:hypothetical protein JTB14_016941 [Gonioctena quinquepunctata]|nr:hypothetical protein JTB14_016941 [Gonioctena quinquepunctata]